MTNTEAIEILKNIDITRDVFSSELQSTLEALEMAIRALKQEPWEKLMPVPRYGEWVYPNCEGVRYSDHTEPSTKMTTSNNIVWDHKSPTIGVSNPIAMDDIK